jgi:hypothetical protein
VVIKSTVAIGEEPHVEIAGFANSSADVDGVSSERLSKRRQKTRPSEVQNQAAVDVAEVSIYTHLNYRSVTVNDILI